MFGGAILLQKFIQMIFVPFHYRSIHHTSNVRLRAPSMDSEFVDSDREDIASSRSNDNNNQHSKQRCLGPAQEAPDSSYFHEDGIEKTDNPSAVHEDFASTKSPHPNAEWVRSPAVSATVIMPQVKPGLMFPRCLSDGVEKFRDENRRLLPKCQNRLHIIDGLEYRYFLGVVDFLTRFDWRQKMAQYWKIIKYRCGDHSTKRPDVYRKRFVDFLNSKVR